MKARSLVAGPPKHGVINSKKSMRILLAAILLSFAGDAVRAQLKESVPTPMIQTIGKGEVWRGSDNKDQHGNDIPPWKEIRVKNVFGFKQRPVIGRKITIVPLDVNIAAQDLTILKIKKGASCGGSNRAWWEVELEPIKQKEYFDMTPVANRRAEVPFDVAIIYPAVRSARQLLRNDLKQSMLPKGVSLDTVMAAIDLTSDGIPDVLIVEYCCGDAGKATGECDYNCGKTFRKVGNSWKLIDTSSPC
jgi:hypothetical protein